jgi:hypothetical protein
MPRTALKYFFDIARECECLQAFLAGTSREG